MPTRVRSLLKVAVVHEAAEPAPLLQAEELSARAQASGLAGFQVTGYVSEEQFRHWLLAVDLGVQLRISPLLGVSGPLSDMAAVAVVWRAKIQDYFFVPRVTC